MTRISMRNVQKSTVEEYFSLYLSSAAAKDVKDKTLETYKKGHFFCGQCPLTLGPQARA